VNGGAAAEVPESFEQAIQRLASIVENLEAGEQPLELSLKLFEEGMALARRSQRLLQQAEQRIEQLLDVTPEGEPVTRSLDPQGD
jgi:exodeoxyribonuclease VII small subunit